jgi:S-adenosyl methyltransferase
MVEGGRAAPGIDTSVPNIARMYDYWLGGKDNFAADRQAADRQVRAIPQLPGLARQNRDFLRRTVRFCAGAGVTQFLDIGSGLPTNQNVHQVAQAVNPDARVVYADIDPVVVNHAQHCCPEARPRPSGGTCATRRRSSAPRRPVV